MPAARPSIRPPKKSESDTANTTTATSSHMDTVDTIHRTVILNTPGRMYFTLLLTEDVKMQLARHTPICVCLQEAHLTPLELCIMMDMVLPL